MARGLTANNCVFTSHSLTGLSQKKMENDGVYVQSITNRKGLFNQALQIKQKSIVLSYLNISLAAEKRKIKRKIYFLCCVFI